MEAHLIRVAALLFVCSSAGATYRTPNFVVNAPTQHIAKQVGKTAEFYRRELAVAWLGEELPGNWVKPCAIKVKVGQIGAGGATTFSFDRGHVFGWDMRVQGTLERILDSVIPHEVSHTILASHFRRPLPRWADEGAATLVEHESERRRQQLTLKQVFKSPRRIPLRKLLTMTEYPSEMQSVLTLYAEGYSLADFLVQIGGKARFLEFLEDAHQASWDAALEKHFGVTSVETLEERWDDWVMAGSPELDLFNESQIAEAESDDRQKTESLEVTIRAQNPETAVIAQTDAAREARSQGKKTHSVSDRLKNTSVQQAGRRSVSAGRTMARSSRAMVGRLRTLNAGWVPVKRRSVSKAGLLVNRADRSSRDRQLPLTDLRLRGAMQPEKIISQKQRSDVSGHSAVWSEFPHTRTGDSSADPGKASVQSFSPR